MKQKQTIQLLFKCLCISGILVTAPVSLYPSSQLTENQKASDEVSRSEQELKSLMAELYHHYRDNKKYLALLKSAHTEWVRYRDSMTELLYQQNEAYSAKSMCRAMYISRLNNLRIAELKSLMQKDEGDVCSGSLSLCGNKVTGDAGSRNKPAPEKRLY